MGDDTPQSFWHKHTKGWMQVVHVLLRQLSDSDRVDSSDVR